MTTPPPSDPFEGAPDELDELLARRVRRALADAGPTDAAMRERHVGEALAAWDELHRDRDSEPLRVAAEPTDPTGSARSAGGAGRVPNRGRRPVLGWIAAAALVVTVGVGTVLIGGRDDAAVDTAGSATAGERDVDDTSTESPAAERDGAPLDSTGGSDAYAERETANVTPTGVPTPELDLGETADAESAVAEARARFSDGTLPVTDEADGSAASPPTAFGDATVESGGADGTDGSGAPEGRPADSAPAPDAACRISPLPHERVAIARFGGRDHLLLVDPESGTVRVFDPVDCSLTVHDEGL